MSGKNKFNIWKWFNSLETDPYKFACEYKKAALYKKHFYLWIFIISSFIALSSTLLLSVLSSLKLAKLWIWSGNVNNNDQTQKFIDNYVYITNTLSAIISFVTTVVAFFAFKQGYLSNRVIYYKLDFELFEYDNNLGHYNDLEESEKASKLIDRTFFIIQKTNDVKKNKGK